MSNPEELRAEERKRGTGWKIYFFLLVIFLIASSFLEESAGMKAVSIFKGVLTAIVLYSWIWAKRISWLSKIRWLVKIWSVQFFIAPIALIIYGYLAFTSPNNEEAIGWSISIIIYYPALYGVYRLAWKSSLLTSAINKSKNSIKPGVA